MDNTKISVVLADANEEFRLALQRALEESEEFTVLGSTGDGLEALQLVEAFRPRLLVFELMLPSLDGFALLDHLTLQQDAPRQIVVSALYREHTVAQALDKGAACFLPKPCELVSLIDRMRTTALEDDASPEDVPFLIARKTTAVMHAIGMPAHMKGYRCVRTAIILAAQDISLIDSMTRSLYPEVARQLGTTPACVERAVRSAIESTWDHADLWAIRRFFGCTISRTRGKPTNGEFIALLADQIRLACIKCPV